MTAFMPPSPPDERVPLASERRLQITPFHAEHVMTLDGVSVNVEAIAHWRIPQAQAAVVSLPDMQQAVASTSYWLLMRTIRSSSFAALLTQRAEIGARLCEYIGRRVTVVVIEGVDISSVIPEAGHEADNDARLLRAMTLRLTQQRLRLRSARETSVSRS